jgi:hypothetical protein
LEQDCQVHAATSGDFKAALEEQKRIFVEMNEEHGKEPRRTCEKRNR